MKTFNCLISLLVFLTFSSLALSCQLREKKNPFLEKDIALPKRDETKTILDSLTQDNKALRQFTLYLLNKLPKRDIKWSILKEKVESLFSGYTLLIPTGPYRDNLKTEIKKIQEPFLKALIANRLNYLSDLKKRKFQEAYKAIHKLFEIELELKNYEKSLAFLEIEKELFTENLLGSDADLGGKIYREHNANYYLSQAKVYGAMRDLNNAKKLLQKCIDEFSIFEHSQTANEAKWFLLCLR